MELDIREYNALSRLGHMYFERGQPSRAAHIFRGLTSISPRDAYAWRMLGACRGELDDPDGSAAAFERALEIDPQDAESRVAYAQLLADHRRGQDAIALLQPVLHRNETRLSPYTLRRARALWRRCQRA